MQKFLVEFGREEVTIRLVHLKCLPTFVIIHVTQHNIATTFPQVDERTIHNRMLVQALFGGMNLAVVNGG